MKRFFILFLFIIFLQPSFASTKQAAIATAHPLATNAGIKILKQGGNAFDAAVTVTAVLAVVEPYSSGLGGGGFWLLHQAKDNSQIMLDGRETAPLAAHRDMYLDNSGNVIEGSSINGAKAAGIPGEPAALVYLAKKYGNLPLSKTLKPAIDLAKNGFPVEAYYQKMMKFRLDNIRQSSAASRIFLSNNEIPKIGELIKQPDLAHVLQQLADKGRQGFYTGEVADKLVKGVQAAGGIWTKEDLSQYKVTIRKPIQFKYKDMTISSAALPSSGGIVLAEIFNILSNYKLETMDEAQSTHIITEAMRRAYRDRAEFMGDSDKVSVPIEQLLSQTHAKKIAQSIQNNKATKSSELPPTSHSLYKGTDTTHFSILDKDGNRVAATLSINYPFGSCFVPEGTGVLLNDEMDDFSLKPNTPNVYGLVGAEANAIAPSKRMLSSMSPTFIEDNDRIALIGSPGGSRIITMVLLGALEFAKGKTAEEIVNAPRFHHQYLPDVIQLEPNALSDKTRKKLESLGHTLDPKDETWGNMQLVIYNKKTNTTTAASDKRVIGKSQVINPTTSDEN